MHRAVAIPILVAVLCFAGPEANAAQPASPAREAQLPNATELLQRALASEKRLAAERERYECRVSTQTIETDSKGQTKKDTTEVSDLFYVNGIPVERLLEKNGKGLSADEQHKQDDRVMKQTVKFSNQANAQKEEDKQNQELEDLMQAMMLANGHREMVNGRSVLFYDIVPNPKFQARNLDQRFARVMQGKVSLDEATGEVIDFNVKSVQDLKIGGGVLADLHKGFWLHINNQPQADGVWLTDLAEGSGDARAAIFFHPYFRFRQTTNDCRLYTATASQVGPAEPVKP
jgi:hypothetical protein